MRFMLKATVPVESGNRVIQEGTMVRTIQSFIEDNKPEAVYFFSYHGDRTLLAFVDIQDASQVAVIGEPLYAQLNAAVEFLPVMTPEDIMKALQNLGQK